MKKCLIKKCSEPIFSRGICNKHYKRWYRGIDEIKELGGHFVKYKTKERSVRCSVKRCTRNISESGSAQMCAAHYQRMLKHGKVFAGKPIIKKDGLPYLDSDGYVIHRKKFQHRSFIEKKIGRKLLNGETVHHKNGNRSDNRLKNLELWSSAQPSGQRVKDKIIYALEIIKQYGTNPRKYE